MSNKNNKNLREMSREELLEEIDRNFEREGIGVRNLMSNVGERSGIKLSELADDVCVALEDSFRVYTVEELKQEISEFSEPHYKKGNWYIVEKRQWEPDAHRMLERYIEMEAEDLYEDWEERVWGDIQEEDIRKIQNILDNIFGNNVTEYWEYKFSKRVDIDVYPKSVLESPENVYISKDNIKVRVVHVGTFEI